MYNGLYAIAIILISIGIAWWLFNGPYLNYRVDFARQRLFEIRDELFRLGKAGELPFDSFPYTSLRITLNGMIRFMHEVGLIRFLVIAIAVRVSPDMKAIANEYASKNTEAMNKLPEEIRMKLEKLHLQAHIIVLSHIIHTSIVLWILFVPIIFLLRRAVPLLRYSKRLVDLTFSGTMNALDAEAANIGKTDSFA